MAAEEEEEEPSSSNRSHQFQGKDVLKVLDARHQDVLDLESSIIELNELFADMENIVESQGEMLEAVEMSVDKSLQYIETAQQDTKSAVSFQSQARRKKNAMIAACLIITAVIITVVVVAGKVM